MARIATGLVLAPLAIGLTLWTHSYLFATLLMLLMLAALVEWKQLRSNTPGELVTVAVFMIVIAALMFIMPALFGWMIVAGSLFWLYQAFDLARYGVDNQIGRLSSLAQGGMIMICAWSGLVFLHRQDNQGPALALGVLLVVWCADTFAYFAGRRYGRRKLAPSISPGKTIEGVIGGLVGAALVSMLVAVLLLDFDQSKTWIWLLAAVLAATMSVVGDLYESRLKRQAGVKDSGNLLPGHGGILDRIDGLVAAAPLFATSWWLLQ